MGTNEIGQVGKSLEERAYKIFTLITLKLLISHMTMSGTALI